jgi:mannose/fructose/N-acetylgalactosamine-specific phosphotransferase system component IIB
LYFLNTSASVVDFSRSKLSNLEIIDSEISKRSKIGGGSITNIRVENSKLELSLGTNSNIETALFENSGDVVVGGGKNNKVFIIKNCPKDTYWLDAGGEGFESIEIENCHVTDLSFSSTSGKKVSIKNSSTYVLDFRGSKIESLILENVKVIQKIKYDEADVQNLESNNVTFGKNIKVWKEDSNIEIKPDKILED